MNVKLANQLLGYPNDARLLIINADDFGMCYSVNQAIMEALAFGIVQSTTLMVPCPWFAHALHFLQSNPSIHFGVHLTVISEWKGYRWGPVLPNNQVPSLVDKDGYFYNFDKMPFFLDHVDLMELELEFRVQIEAVLSAGLNPTHLDWHSLRLRSGHDHIFDLFIKLAREYGLALRVYGRKRIEGLHAQGFPTNDYDFMDSYLLDPSQKENLYKQLLRDLPEGLNEWAVHPGLDNAELQAIEVDSHHERQTDFDFLASQSALDLLKEEGIILLSYKPLQELWNTI
ncbi:MAG: polysaccharide deacetylase family protein [Anaerolineales bacterium]